MSKIKCRNCSVFAEGLLNERKLFYCIASPETEDGNVLFKPERLEKDQDDVFVYEVFPDDDCVSMFNLGREAVQLSKEKETGNTRQGEE